MFSCLGSLQGLRCALFCFGFSFSLVTFTDGGERLTDYVVALEGDRTRKDFVLMLLFVGREHLYSYDYAAAKVMVGFSATYTRVVRWQVSVWLKEQEVFCFQWKKLAETYLPKFSELHIWQIFFSLVFYWRCLVLRSKGKLNLNWMEKVIFAIQKLFVKTRISVVFFTFFLAANIHAWGHAATHFWKAPNIWFLSVFRQNHFQVVSVDTKHKYLDRTHL